KIEEITGFKGTPVRTAMFTDKFTVQGKLAPGAAPVAWLSVPSTADAGSRLLGGTTTTKTVTVANSGAGTLTLQGITLGGDDAGDFALDTSACGATLAPAQACNLSYTFTPSAAGTRSATVTVASNVGSQTIALTGTGAAPPAPAPEPVSVPAPVVDQPRPPVAQPTRAPQLEIDAVTVTRRMSLRTARRGCLGRHGPEPAAVVAAAGSRIALQRSRLRLPRARHARHRPCQRRVIRLCAARRARDRLGAAACAPAARTMARPRGSAARLAQTMRICLVVAGPRFLPLAPTRITSR